MLERLGGKTLRPAVVMAVLDGVTAEMAPKLSARTVEKLRADVQDAERALSNLSKAIAAGRRLDSLVAELEARQAERDRLLAMMTPHERTAGQRIDRRAIEQAMKRHTDRRRSLLTNLRGILQCSR